MCRAQNGTISAKIHVPPSKANEKNYAVIGNIIHTVHLINIVVFAWCVVTYSNKTKDSLTSTTKIFDPVWEKDGFCISNPTQLYWTSHDLCLYADTILAVLLGFCYLWLKDTPGMKSANDLVKWNVLGIIGHGIGHGGIARYIRNHTLSGGVLELPPVLHLSDFFMSVQVIQQNIPSLLFWIPLIKATMPNNCSHITVLLISWLSIIGGRVTPSRFGFTYTQTILFICFSWNQLLQCRADKNFAYALYAAVVSFPLGLLAWLESMACSNFIIHYGGHLIYDAYIPLSSILFYLCCYHKEKISAGYMNQEKIQ